MVDATKDSQGRRTKARPCEPGTRGAGLDPATRFPRDLVSDRGMSPRLSATASSCAGGGPVKAPLEPGSQDSDRERLRRAVCVPGGAVQSPGEIHLKGD